MTPLFADEQILRLIPQRPPMVMIDAVLDACETGITTALTIRDDNFFLHKQCLQESGLVEHMAQTAAAFAGYANLKNQTAPKVGFIGEVKDMTCVRLPKLGETVSTTLTTVADMAGVTLVECNAVCGEENIAHCMLKIFIQP